MARIPDREALYEVAERFADVCLLEGGSLFSSDQPLWHGEALQDLYGRTVESPDVSKASFYEKFRLQLEGAPADRYQLAVEGLAVHQLVADDFTAKTKRDALRRVAAWSPEPIRIPELVDAAMQRGLAATGVAFKTFKPYQLWLVFRLARAFEQRGREERQALLDDPWAFKELLYSLPVASAYAQREALLHLVHPDAFEPIVSRDHKKAIDEAFAELVDAEVTDIDQRLGTIREALSAEVCPDEPEAFTFYRPEVFERWHRPQKPSDGEKPHPPGQRAWLLRGVFEGKSAVPDWIENSYVAIGWPELGELPDGLTREELTKRMGQTYPDHSLGRLRNSVGNVDRFLNQMAIGDFVVTPDGSDVYVGLVNSEPYWVSSAGGRRDLRRRSVEWANAERPLQREEVSEAAYSKMRTLLTVTEITDLLAEFAAAVGLDIAETEAVTEPAKGASLASVQLRAPTEELAEDLLLDRSWLEEIVELFDGTRQLILYGPPGTGKTFLAQRLARHFTAEGGTYQLVQFHPSYAYEDFFEGFRPRQSADEAGTLQFELVPGPLRALADAAREEPTKPFVLVIDELNRANLPKVFGELYFLLEYRDESVSLQYSSESDFQLPRNLFVIGTMNTADRSIALVDAAMRRRFMFAGLFPGEPPIDDLLGKWLDRHGLSREPATLLEELNARLDDRDAAVGPSYLMHESVATEKGLERTWRYALMPLLEEYFAGSGRDVEAEFGLTALRRAVSTRTREEP